MKFDTKKINTCRRAARFGGVRSSGKMRNSVTNLAQWTAYMCTN